MTIHRNVPVVYNTLSDLQMDKSLRSGMIVQTMGLDHIGDKLGSYYEICEYKKQAFDEEYGDIRFGWSDELYAHPLKVDQMDEAINQITIELSSTLNRLADIETATEKNTTNVNSLITNSSNHGTSINNISQSVEALTSQVSVLEGVNDEIALLAARLDALEINDVFVDEEIDYRKINGMNILHLSNGKRAVIVTDRHNYQILHTPNYPANLVYSFNGTKTVAYDRLNNMIPSKSGVLYFDVYEDQYYRYNIIDGIYEPTNTPLELTVDDDCSLIRPTIAGNTAPLEEIFTYIRDGKKYIWRDLYGTLILVADYISGDNKNIYINGVPVEAEFGVTYYVKDTNSFYLYTYYYEPVTPEEPEDEDENNGELLGADGDDAPDDGGDDSGEGADDNGEEGGDTPVIPEPQYTFSFLREDTVEIPETPSTAQEDETSPYAKVISTYVFPADAQTIEIDGVDSDVTKVYTVNSTSDKTYLTLTENTLYKYTAANKKYRYAKVGTTLNYSDPNFSAPGILAEYVNSLNSVRVEGHFYYLEAERKYYIFTRVDAEDGNGGTYDTYVEIPYTQSYLNGITNEQAVTYVPAAENNWIPTTDMMIMKAYGDGAYPSVVVNSGTAEKGITIAYDDETGAYVIKADLDQSLPFIVYYE